MEGGERSSLDLLSPALEWLLSLLLPATHERYRGEGPAAHQEDENERYPYGEHRHTHHCDLNKTANSTH